ncbi:hypothetical protein [Hyphomonas sp.]|uniref:hypothetical protein n=1 Tax=Hyphomonas sp. TaxID=87 RepID=UPI003565E02E
MLRTLIPLNLKAVEAGARRKVARVSVFGPTAQVVPRSACSFERIWMPRTDRKGIEAVRMRMSRDTGNGGPVGIFIEKREHTGAGFLNVWIWETQLLQLDDKPSSNLVVPETFARAPGPDGARLAACLSGFEGQIWDTGQLVASRWWRSHPSDRDWREFISGSEVIIGGAALDAQRLSRVPEPESPPWRLDLSLSDIEPSAIEGMLSPARVALAAAVIIALPLGFVSGNGLKLSGYNAATAAKLTQLKADVGDVMDARRIASDNKLQIDRMTRIGDPFKLIDVLVELRTAIGPDNVTLRYLAFDAGNIEVKISTTNTPRLADLVSRLEDGEVWQKVSATTEAGNIIVLRGELATGANRS